MYMHARICIYFRFDSTKLSDSYYFMPTLWRIWRIVNSRTVERSTLITLFKVFARAKRMCSFPSKEQSALALILLSAILLAKHTIIVSGIDKAAVGFLQTILHHIF